MSSSISILSKRVEYFIWQMRNKLLAELHVGEVELNAMEVKKKVWLGFLFIKKKKRPFIICIGSLAVLLCFEVV